VPAAPAGAGLPVRPSHPPRRSLGSLAVAVPGLQVLGGATGTVVTGCALDSRAVQPGDLYAALPGARAHGADFAGQAAGRGAAAVLTDPAGQARAAVTGLPVVVAENPLSCVALGTGRALEEMKRLRNVLTSMY